MTSPEQEQPPPPPEETPLVAKVAALLSVAAGMEATIAAVQIALKPLNLAADAVAGAVRLALRSPLQPVGGSGQARVSVRVTEGRRNTAATPGGSAGGYTRDREIFYRAAYIINGAKRIHKSMREGKNLREALVKERPNFNAHLNATRNRTAKARAVDHMAARYGPLLGWYAVMDARTSAECRAANRKNFEASRKPLIGYPGTVHPHCRCVPGKPIEGAAMLPTAKTRPKPTRRTA